ncbi:MAG: hypothetical protein N2043_01690 [Ignavibacterium sp.]|nr:hypothetical protein [Ignavibacterium sp.]
MYVFKNNNDIPQELILGYLIFSSIDSDVSIEKENLIQMFKDEGIQSLSPNIDLKAHDIFRRVTSDYQNFVIEESPTQTRKILVREFESNQKKITRIFTVETLEKQKEPTYNVSLYVTLNKETETIEYSIRPNCVVNLDNIIKDIQQKFNYLMNTIDKKSFTNISTKIINQLRPVQLFKNARTKFIPKEYKNELNALKRIFESLNSVFEIVPLIDTEEQRNLILNGFSNQTENDLNEMIYEINQILSGNANMTKSKMKTFHEKLSSINENVQYYEKLLMKKDILSQQLKMLKQKLMVLEIN